MQRLGCNSLPTTFYTIQMQRMLPCAWCAWPSCLLMFWRILNPTCRMLDCVALLALELLPHMEDLNSNPALQPYGVGPAWSELLKLLCVLLRTERTQAVAQVRGAGAALRRALAGELVSSGPCLAELVGTNQSEKKHRQPDSFRCHIQMHRKCWWAS